ncbi:glycosyltransferase family 4 protein [Adhaeribacter pallidiroseus]|uniref:Protein RfbU n=1 Tax=Adhaeribacter pallidiroseus TaxID=2072847 RepID=A0A369QIC0_9BACT|nr:glycosyltransferase family 1 protein [Adhaeribacter pallidiroseus]RDC62976.1 Protein RfbU [Adhaeribacter pallidiroseus]
MLFPEIYVNARFLTQPITGVQRFAIEISKQLKKIIPGINFIAPKAIIHQLIAEELEVITFGSYSGHVWEQIELPLFLKKCGAVLLLNLANTAPLFFDKNIITIHDLAFKVNPQWFSKPFSIYYNWLIPKISRKALHIFTVSEASKKEINKLIGIPAHHITVAYNAVSNNLEIKANQSTNRLNIPEKYILSVASVDPRKNLLCLIDAYVKLALPGFKLCLVGRKYKVFAESNLFALIKANSNIIFLEDTSDTELALLYQHAQVFVYPSFYEGFGIPNLEAMALQCAVITSDIPVFREVCGEAALYFNPDDSSQLAEKIATLLSNPENKNRMKQKGKIQAEKFNWFNSAQKYEQIVLKLLIN